MYSLLECITLLSPPEADDHTLNCSLDEGSTCRFSSSSSCSQYKTQFRAKRGLASGCLRGSVGVLAVLLPSLVSTTISQYSKRRLPFRVVA